MPLSGHPDALPAARGHQAVGALRGHQAMSALFVRKKNAEKKVQSALRPKVAALLAALRALRPLHAAPAVRGDAHIIA